MAFFAKIVDGIVRDVIVADHDYIATQDGTWVETCRDTFGGKHYDPVTGQEDDGVAIRKNYAGLGYTYDPSLDAFYSPQPFASWVLDTETCLWQAPIPKPEGNYSWDEVAYQADTSNPKTAGWVQKPGIDDE